VSASQVSYQVRFDWGHVGASTIGVDADAVVWVDQLGSTEAPVDAVTGTLEQASALGAWALARQEELGGRFRIAVVAAGAERPDGSLRFAVEDLLAAGAIIDAIAEVGIDHQSPEAAAAAAAFVGLRSATKHLIAASVSARESRAREFREG
jgi:phosphosulfolactate phosphohydrolase-like enzyme